MLWDFFTQIYRLPMMVFKRALSNPMGIFVYGILSKWYAMVMIATIIITFWVFKGLEKAGVIDAVNSQLRQGFGEAQSVAQNCTPLIMNLKDMWSCIQNPPAYLPGADDIALRDGIMQDSETNVSKGAEFGNRNYDGNAPVANPYDEDDLPQTNSAAPATNSPVGTSGTNQTGTTSTEQSTVNRF